MEPATRAGTAADLGSGAGETNEGKAAKGFRRVAADEFYRLIEKGRRASVAIDDAQLAADDIDELWQSVDAR
jgi:hypothetical protein